ncbi:MAG TPA: hypothetical protein PLG17_06510 [Thermodesulfobacteriota bacterium]|nr:hypothetical protein [Deltaproteobacteria bacterium]HNR14304.1 hypothetical protein [Thermodesulfobacteriota bacterium]HNU72026.1 hypothetical protein [Thermodesulfobacteriota bacterium]HQO78147.1 hypothetical protein [Thermodesulfobacteriota bacterium]
MNSLSNDYPAGLLNAHEPPCLSLYQLTHRGYPENQQDPIRFRNLVKAMEESLRIKYPRREIQPLLKPFHNLVNDPAFWRHTLDGLAVLRAPDLFRIYRLQRPVAELIVVADSFHTKPLMRIFQSADRFQILGLDRQEIHLYEGNRDVIDEIELAQDVPRTITEALGEELTEPHQTVASYGTGVGGPAMHHGHGSKKDEIDVDEERFFRAVDRAVLEHHSQPSGLPLILAALPEYHTPFRTISQNPFLLPEGIHSHPNALSRDALRERVWRVIEPCYLARLAGLIEEFGEAKAKGLGDDDLVRVAKAAVIGRVAKIMIEAERKIPGRIVDETGRIEFNELSMPDVDDLLDDVGELALRMGGHVVIVPAERMPTHTGLAAIYRF